MRWTDETTCLVGTIYSLTRCVAYEVQNCWPIGVKLCRMSLPRTIAKRRPMRSAFRQVKIRGDMHSTSGADRIWLLILCLSSSLYGLSRTARIIHGIILQPIVWVITPPVFLLSFASWIVLGEIRRRVTTCDPLYPSILAHSSSLLPVVEFLLHSLYLFGRPDPLYIVRVAS